MAIATRKNDDTTVTGHEPAVDAGRDAVQEISSATKRFADSAVSESTAGLEHAQSQMKGNMEKAMKTAEEVISFGQGNVEAVLKSSQIWAAGVQDLSKHLAATAQAQLDHTMAAMRAFSGVKSLKEAVDLQNSLARSSLEKAVSDAGRMTDASMKLAEQTLAPISARVNLAVEKFGRPVA